MNSNKQKFWMWADVADWRLDAGVDVDRERRTLQLASRRSRPIAPEDEALARLSLSLTPAAHDRLGGRARWSSAQKQIIATSTIDSEVVIVDQPGNTCTDLAVGYDDLLFACLDGNVWATHVRDLPFEQNVINNDALAILDIPGDVANRLTATSTSAFVLGQGGTIAQVNGQLWRSTPPEGGFDEKVFRPKQENPNPLRVDVLTQLAKENPTDVFVSIAAPDDGSRLAVLVWRQNQAQVLILDPNDPAEVHHHVLSGVRWPYSMAWIGDGSRVAMRVTGQSEAIVYALPDHEISPHSTILEPVGTFYPLVDALEQPWDQVVSGAPAYGTSQTTWRRLHPLSLPSFARSGVATAVTLGGSRDAVDGQTPNFVWDKLYLEANIPTQTGVIIWCAASNDPVAPEDIGDWHPHLVGSVQWPLPESQRSAVMMGTPITASGPPSGGRYNGPVARLAWSEKPSEVPFAPSLLPCDLAPNQRGLFTALIQRAGRRTSALRGRYLFVRIQLLGNVTATPEVAALRVWGERFCYVDEYLPELYQETLAMAEADEVAARTTQPDFLKRLIANMSEAMLMIEERVAHAHELTLPKSSPRESLSWLAGWIGASMDGRVPEHCQRAVLAHSVQLHQWRGTLKGLAWMLDLATDGAVSKGQIVLLENYRLRRTVASILGMAEEADPDGRAPWQAIRGHSFVGETLVLAEKQEQDEFKAIFGLDGVERLSDAVAAWYAQYAHRLSVLVQREHSAKWRAVVESIVETELPAHLTVDILDASHPLVVGVYALVGVDTYLGRPSGPRAVRVEQSTLGRGDRVQRPPSVDPRIEGGDPT